MYLLEKACSFHGAAGDSSGRLEKDSSKKLMVRLLHRSTSEQLLTAALPASTLSKEGRTVLCAADSDSSVSLAVRDTTQYRRGRPRQPGRNERVERALARNMTSGSFPASPFSAFLFKEPLIQSASRPDRPCKDLWG